LKLLKTNHLKVPQLLLQYLLDQHAFRLEGLGTVRLDAPPAGFLSEKGEISIPPGCITFESDPHATADDAFIGHIVQQTGKMRSLATSDMESFTETGKQLLNISKPFVLDQIGVLQRDAHGLLHFTQGEIVIEKEENIRKRHKSSDSDESVHFDDNYRKPTVRAGGRPQMAGIVLMVILAIALLGWVTRYFYLKSAHDSEGQLELQSPPAVEVKDPLPAPVTKPSPDTTTRQASTPSDQPIQSLDSVKPAPLVTTPAEQPAGDFKVVILVATHERAQRRYDSLIKWGHQVVMSPVDSDRFELAIPIHAPLSDSIHHRDSLSRFFGRKVWIETR
jgi:hypothetical protein